MRRARGWGPQDGVSALNKTGPESSPALSRSLSLSSSFSPSLSPSPSGGTARRRPPTSREEGSRRRPNLPALDPRLAAPEPCKGVLPEPHLWRWLQRPELTQTPSRGPPRDTPAEVLPAVRSPRLRHRPYSLPSCVSARVVPIAPKHAELPFFGDSLERKVAWRESGKLSSTPGSASLQLCRWKQVCRDLSVPSGGTPLGRAWAAQRRV